MKSSWIPNLLTILRCILTLPVILGLLWGYPKIAFWLFIIAGFSDALDGFLARNFNWSSRFGSILDPLADKFLMLAVFITLCYLDAMPLWVLLTIIIRDVIIISGGVAYQYLVGSFEMNPNKLSKLNTCLQLLLITLLMWQISYHAIPQKWLINLMYIVFLTNITSLIQYVWQWSGRALRGEHL